MHYIIFLQETESLKALADGRCIASLCTYNPGYKLEVTEHKISLLGDKHLFFEDCYIYVPNDSVQFYFMLNTHPIPLVYK